MDDAEAIELEKESVSGSSEEGCGTALEVAGTGVTIAVEIIPPGPLEAASLAVDATSRVDIYRLDEAPPELAEG